MTSLYTLISTSTNMCIAVARRIPRRASHTRTTTTRLQQHHSPTSRLRICISATSCLSDHPPRTSQNDHHVHSQTSRRTTTPGRSTRSRTSPTRKHRDICVNSSRRLTWLRLQGLTDPATTVHQHLRSASAPHHLCLTHLHRRSATHYPIPLRPRARCHHDTTRTAIAPSR